MNWKISSAISINSDVYSMDYGAMKSSKNAKFVLKKLSVSSRQKQKLSRQNFLLNFNCLDNMSRRKPS